MLMHPGPLGVDHSRPGRSTQVNPIGYSGARERRDRTRRSWAALRRGASIASIAECWSGEVGRRSNAYFLIASNRSFAGSRPCQLGELQIHRRRADAAETPALLHLDDNAK